VFYADFNWDLIIKALSGKIKFTDIPKYPEVRRDLALLIDQNVSMILFMPLRQTEKPLKASIYLMYIKEQSLKAKKSYIKFIQDNSKPN
jgi:phenylalanyl-tRNA synthetase beta chain